MSKQTLGGVFDTWKSLWTFSIQKEEDIWGNICFHIQYIKIKICINKLKARNFFQSKSTRVKPELLLMLFREILQFVVFILFIHYEMYKCL